MILRLENDDCMKIMAEYPDKYFDLAVVDPPYGIGNWVQIGGNIRRNKLGVTWNEEEHRPNNEYFIELKRVSKERIIWGANYYNCFEENMGAIVWDKKNPNPKFSNVEIASYSKHKRVAMVTIPYYGFVGEEKCFHPCAKPINLYSWIFKNYAEPEMKILDTHLGSGSSLIAADKFGISEFVGCEIDKEYFEAMIKRYNIYKSQYRLEFAL